MSLEVIKQINVDFYDPKYILINAKQYDRKSRIILVNCYNNGVVFPLNRSSHYAYIRYRKEDDLGVFNSCKITYDGKIRVELTEQMLASVGKCYADLVIFENEPIKVNENTGELIVEDNDSIVSTMKFCVNVIENAFDNTEIESSYEYNALDELLIKATEDYSYVMKACKISEDNAKTSEENAKRYADNASTYADNAEISEINAKTSENNAKSYESNAKIYADNANTSSINAKASEDIATTKASEASQSATTSANNAITAIDKATESSNYATMSKSYAVGGTDTRTGEDEDNSKYYYTQTKAVSDSIDGSFLPMGTIEYSALQSSAKDTGYVYHIKDDFITDDSFKCGAGVSYLAGTNVYYTADGYWDCFVGQSYIVEEIRNLNEIIAGLQERISAIESKTTLEISE